MATSNRRRVRAAGLRAAAALLAACCGLGRAAPQLPTEAFARLPQLQSVALSPDGRWFAAVMNRGDDTLAVARPVDGDGSAAPLKPLLKNDNRESRLAWLRWVSNERLVISVAYPSRRGSVDTTETRLLAVGRDGSKPVTLVEPGGVAFGSTTQLQDRVVDWLPGDGHHILLQAVVDRRDVSPAVVRVDTDTGAREVVQGRRFGVRRWFTDGAHRVRVGLSQIGTAVQVLLCDPSGDNWRTAWAYEALARDAVMPLGFGADPNLLYVSADNDGRRAVFEVDLRNPALPRRLVLDRADRDVLGSLLTDPASGRAIGISGGDMDDAPAHFWDPATQALARAVDDALPGRANRLLQWSADGSRYLLHTSGNGIPGQFMVGDMAGARLSLIGKQYPELDQAAAAGALVRKQRLTIAARDGVQLPAYLTLPPAQGGGADAKQLPTVVLPHGGPLSHDMLDFDPLAEFLAHRGYAVLQVNFRGSTGFGYEHMSAGLKRWGLEMQDDLADALQWLVRRGTADPARVCIVGASYGGYAALMGGAKTPGLYRCVVSLAGVSDLQTMAAYRAHYVNGYDMFARQFGSAWADSQQLQDTSPARLAAQFQAPVLLLHGTRDRVVPIEQSKTMAAALAAAGKPVRLLELQDGDHELGQQAMRLQFYRELEAFLGHWLAAPATVAGTSR